MNLIVAVYDDWGIGHSGTQPVALSADRKFFRETTHNAMVIVGRRTVEDFPNQKPLPNRINVVLTSSLKELPGFQIVSSVEEAAALAAGVESAFVIGGGSIYRQMLPLCNTAYVTKIHTVPESDTFFPDLDKDTNWVLSEILQTGEENGIPFEICVYKRKGTV